MHDLAQGFQAAIVCGEGGIFSEPMFKIEHARGIEFAVERRLGEEGFFDGRHFAPLPAKAAMRSARARARRDMTVPKGAPVISAISR